MSTRLFQYQERFFKLYSMLIFPVSVPGRLVYAWLMVIPVLYYKVEGGGGGGGEDGIHSLGFLLRSFA